MTKTITVYRDQRFMAEAKPDWWEAELDRMHPPAGSTVEPLEARGHYGEEFGSRIESWDLTDDRGVLVELRDGDRGTYVWVPSVADWLDFLTTRATAFIGLTVSPNIPDTLERLCNALVAFVRHGAGDHINRFTGTSHIDEGQDLEARQELAKRQ